MEAPLVFDSITKRFGRDAAPAVDDLSLTLERGEILGFLGANGAGKTTAMQLAMGMLRPTSGEGRLLGARFGDARTRAHVGFAPDAPVFFAGTAMEALALAARLSGMRPERARLEETLRRVGVLDTKHDTKQDIKRDVRKFSRGMQQRLALAMALVHDPEVLILDEPAAALDPAGVLEVRALLRGLRDAGCSILLSSHQLAEVEQICDRVAFLGEGKLLHIGSLQAILEVPDQVEVTVRGLRWGSPARLRYAKREVVAAIPEQTSWVLPMAEQRRAIEAAWQDGAELVSVRPARRSLLELFAPAALPVASDDPMRRLP